MSATILENESVVRLSLFLSILLLMVLWEILSPRRTLSHKKLVRFYSNLGIATLGTIMVKVLFATSAVGLSLLAKENSWGLFNHYRLPFHLEILFSVVLLDLTIYFQHVMFHAVPLLWRLHRTHHADQDYDVTTGVRFHPIEITLSMAIKFSVIYILGPSPISVLVFEVLLNALSMFNHGNVYIHPTIDQVLRWFVVTPDMHRIHHSIVRNETNSNFGFNLSWWDKIFGTYIKEPKNKQETMTIGIDLFRKPQYLHLHLLLLLPFLKGGDRYSINNED